MNQYLNYLRMIWISCLRAGSGSIQCRRWWTRPTNFR